MDGLALLSLLDWQPQWILRRVERGAFEDALTIRCRTTLDIFLGRLEEDPKVALIPTLGDRILLPIMQVSRLSHHDVSIEDAHGQSLPFLPRSEERRLLSEGLAEYYLEAQAGEIEGNVKELQQAILKLINQAPSKAEKLPDRFAHIATHIRNFQQNNLVIAAIKRDDVFDKYGFKLLRISETHASSLPWSNPASRKVAPILGRDYLAYQTRNRVAYSGHSTFRPTDWVPLWRKPASLDDTLVVIPVPLMDTAESYHMEVACPSGAYVSKATLVSTMKLPSGRIEVLEVVEDDRHWNVAHASFHIGMHTESEVLAEDIQSRRLDSGFLLVLRPMYHGLMRTGKNVSLISVGLLWLLTFTLGWDGLGWPPVIEMPRASNPQLESIVAMMLLVPTVILSFIVRQDENLMTKSVADGFRRRIGMLATITFAAALILAVGVSDWLLFAGLCALSGMGTIVAARTWSSARRSELQLRQPPSAPSWV